MKILKVIGGVVVVVLAVLGIGVLVKNKKELDNWNEHAEQWK